MGLRIGLAAGLGYLSALLLCGSAAWAEQFRWIDPTPAELAMTAYAKAPGAAAVILSSVEENDATTADLVIHVRIKVLAEGGLSAANVEVPLGVDIQNSGGPSYFFGRTIHSDGSIAIFSGKASENFVTSSAGKQTVALPSATVGSILEYGYHRSGYPSHDPRYGLYSPLWKVQKQYFVCAARFKLYTSEMDRTSIRWVAQLPSGVEVKQIKDNVYLEASDVPALPEEEFSPPASMTGFRVRFFYLDGTRDFYWAKTGSRVDESWINFYKPTKTLVAAVGEIVAPGDTDSQKLHKLYDAVMAMDNSDLSRQHSGREDKQEGLKEAWQSEDIWRRKRGNSSQLALLFVALVRAAGIDAYPMAVTSRDQGVFSEDVLTWSQLDSIVAIAIYKGSPTFFDPGTRGCAFGHLASWHADVEGISFEGKEIKFRKTPNEIAKDSRIMRSAELTLDAQGGVTGTARVVWSGGSGLTIRQKFLREDRLALEAATMKQLAELLPTGVQAAALKLGGLDQYDAAIVADFTVTGKLGTSAGKRLLIPTQFFASTMKPSLASASRTSPISFPEMYTVTDSVRIVLPTTLAVESVPVAASFRHFRDTGYSASTIASDGALSIQRSFVMARRDYPVQEYADLHEYFGSVASSDQEVAVLHEATP